LFPVTPTAATPCKICGGASLLLDVVDFHKSCIEAEGKRLPLSGIPVYYRQCTACSFVFTDFFDDWSTDAFARHIYNEAYQMVDPDYTGHRARSKAEAFRAMFDAHRDRLQILDYGGGAGKFAEILTGSGYRCLSYDPYGEHRTVPEGKFDIVTSFEVLEHSTDPRATLRDVAQCLAPGGVILFSTLVQPADFAQRGARWWYIGPRNGHVSIFSRTALATLLSGAGYRFGSFNDDMHIAYIELPDFARHLVGRP
jgi:2-polyprenyl-6-hydroxyphenyl methylase/3-demethylubiquinone-9 3-methyltransferase